MKKNVMFISFTTFSLALGATVAFSIAKQNSEFTLFSSKAENRVYTITLDKNSVQLDGEGKFTYVTSDGNTIEFETSGLSISGDNLVLASGGYIKNPYKAEGNHNKISGLLTIENTFVSGEKLRVDYTWGDSLQAASPYYQRRNYVVPNWLTDGENPVNFPYGFLSEAPNYLCVKATADTTVENIVLKYSCVSGEEAGDNLIVNSASTLERFKTVVNWGNSFEGQTVELSADIDMSEINTSPIGNATYPFSGVFEGHNHTISNLTLSEATMIAPFGNVVNGVVKNVIFENVSATATGQRAAGAVARVQDSVIDNVSVTGTSTVNGSKENGGIAGVIIGESIISNCVSDATISGSANTWTSNGGIAGTIYSADLLPARVTIYNCTNNGTVTSSCGTAYNGFIGGILGSTLESTSNTLYRIINCTNNGTINAPKCNYVGGIVGLPRKGVEGSVIALCENNGTVTANTFTGGISGAARVNVVSCSSSPSATINGNAAADLNAKGGASSTPGYITGTAEKIDGSAVAFVTGSIVSVEISSKAELEAYRDAVNAGTATAGAKLTADIVLSSDENFTPIGTSDNKFAFTFDGNGHTISNLKNSGTNYLGLFGYIQGGGVKNLSLSNVNLTASSGNVGAVAGQLSLGAIAEVSVSGSVSGTTCNGGLVGSVNIQATKNPSVIAHCTNSSSVTSTSTQYSGGIVGFTNSNTNLTIFDCENTGTITGKSMTGGIIGASANTGHLIVENCVNRGSVSIVSGGNAFGGGIIGLAREQSVVVAEIRNCKNYANVVSGSSNSVGGIAGLARINVTNCSCLSTITVNNNSATATEAYGVLIVGTAGGTKVGIIVGGLGNQKTMSGCYTFNASGDVVQEFDPATAPSA